jgi:hypothetical protein
MGRSAQTYVNMAAVRGGRQRIADEIWAINSMGGVIQHDLLFHMDDCRIQEARATAQPGENVWGMLQWLKSHPKFMTSKVYPEYPGAIAFPLEQVINAIGTTYLNNTVAYAVAYAMFLGFNKISLFGVDYSYPDLHKAESGRGCVEFLLGMAAARGIHIEVAADSTLMDACVDPKTKPYGYDAYDVSFEQTESGVNVKMTDREIMPSAAEIERRYRHDK